jgi:hypothetical protein
MFAFEFSDRDSVPGGGVRLQEMVLVTDEGPYVMSRAPFDDKLIL